MAWRRQLRMCIFALIVIGHQLVGMSDSVKTCQLEIPSDGVCEESDRPCPKICPGVPINQDSRDYGAITEENIECFKNCTVINGSIVITASTYDGDPFRGLIGLEADQIANLKTIRVVTGFVLVKHSAAYQDDLAIFENLEVIQGNELYRCDELSKSLSDPNDKAEVCEMSPRGYALTVQDTTVTSLGLVSLREISDGSVFIRKNPKMCYVSPDMFSTVLQDTETQKVSIRRNKDTTDCSEEGSVCHEQCTDIGCWGPGADMCVECSNYILGKRCVEECDINNGQYVSSETDKECGLCDSQCNGSCNGPGASNCTSCRNMQDGPMCLEECPITKYPDGNSVCQDCHENCRLEGENPGCTGPLRIFGQGGCKSCRQVLINASNPDVLCMNTNDGCPERYFGKVHLVDRYKNSLVCSSCDAECLSCRDGGNDNCTECLNYRQGRFCVPRCSPNFYGDEDNICQKCNGECLEGCYGDSPAQCNECKNYEIPLDLENAEVSVCVSECPADKPYIMDGKVCVSNCTGNTYVNEDNHCMPCHEQCQDGCLDETVRSCIRCKHYNSLQGCVDFCPSNRTENGRCMITGDPPQDSSVEVIVGCVVAILGVGIIVLLVVVYYLRKRHMEEKTRRYMEEEYTLDTFAEPLSPSGAEPNKAFLRIIKETELQKGGILGAGAFGTVYKGLWVPEGDNVRIPVAIKVMREGISTKANQELLEEAYVMATVNHKHLVRLLCVCMSQNMMLITQLMPLGALLDYIREHKDKVSSQHLLNWCTQIARGMVYLEEHRLVHRDLAARNVLVESPTKVKITDFGLAKFIEINEEEYKAEGGKMPIKWLALECITYRRFTHQSDVWSFGVTVWELMTFGGRPYEGIKARDVPHMLEIGERLPQPKICTIDVYMIMLKCWMLDENSRPTFTELVDTFTKMARDPQRYLMLESECKEPLPSPSKEEFYRNLIPDVDGPEVLMDADDYLQPVSTTLSDSGNSNDGVPHAYTYVHDPGSPVESNA